MHGPPATAWLKPVTHVHAPVPVMPWSHTPPTPQLHGRHDAPYWFRPHWPHDVPFGNVPLGHADTHVCVGGSSRSGEVQVWQYVALYWHVAQLPLQVEQTLVATLANVPTGQFATQVVPLRYGSAPVGRQLVQDDVPAAKHAKHGAWQPAHAWPLP